MSKVNKEIEFVISHDVKTGKTTTYDYRFGKVRELVKDGSLRVTDIAKETGYNKGHVSRLRKEAMKNSSDFECPRCGHCCQTENLELQKAVIRNLLSIMNDNSYIARDRLKAAELLTNTTFFRNDYD